MILCFSYLPIGTPMKKSIRGSCPFFILSGSCQSQHGLGKGNARLSQLSGHLAILGGHSTERHTIRDGAKLRVLSFFLLQV